MVEYAADTRVCPGALIHPLRFRGEGSPGQSKKKIMDLSKSILEDIDSCRLSSANAFNDIFVQIQGVKELFYRLP